MSRKIIDKERWEASKNAAYQEMYGQTPTLAKWLVKSAILITLLYLFTGIWVFVFPSLSLLLVIPFVISMFYIHEVIHLITAISLGHKPIWRPTTLTKVPLIGNLVSEGFDISFTITDTDLGRKKFKQDRLLIALTPYFLIFPLSISFIIYFLLVPDNIIFMLAGGILLFSHLISINLEAKTL